MHKLLQSASVGIIVLLTSGQLHAQTWKLTPEEAEKYGVKPAPKVEAPAAPKAEAPATPKAQAPAAPSAAIADDELMRLSKDPKQWVSPTGDYANLRHSALKQITADNVGKLQPAWQFSTGVLRGHEGAPLVLNNVSVTDQGGKTITTDVMYLHTPFPNI
ncbi:MAG: hypothetical protein ACR650_13310, partial [Methylocystis sp.]